VPGHVAAAWSGGPRAPQSESPLPARTKENMRSGRDGLADRLATEASDARIRVLEAALEALRSRHAEEVHDLEVAGVDLRSEIETMRLELSRCKAAIAERDQANISLGRDLKTSHIAVAEHEREIARLRDQVETRSREAERLQAQLTLALEQLKRSDSDANAARWEKERSLAPLSVQAGELSRNLAVKQKQVEVLQHEVEASHRHAASLQAEAAARREQAAQVMASQNNEILQRDETIKRLHSDLQAQAEQHRRVEQQLTRRCRLLQAWCFRIWWSMEAGDDVPGVLAGGDAPGSGKSGSSSEVALPLRPPGPPPPADWRRVLRFQASLFHWLGAATIKGKAQNLRGSSQEPEARAAVDVLLLQPRRT